MHASGQPATGRGAWDSWVAGREGDEAHFGAPQWNTGRAARFRGGGSAPIMRGAFSTPGGARAAVQVLVAVVGRRVVVGAGAVELWRSQRACPPAAAAQRGP